MMLITDGEKGEAARTLRQTEAKQVTIKWKRPREVAHFHMNMAETKFPRALRNIRRCSAVGFVPRGRLREWNQRTSGCLAAGAVRMRRRRQD
jgi:hypothetical protein